MCQINDFRKNKGSLMEVSKEGRRRKKKNNDIKNEKRIVYEERET